MKKNQFSGAQSAQPVAQPAPEQPAFREIRDTQGAHHPNNEMQSRFVYTVTETIYPGEPPQTQCSPFHLLVYCVTDCGECLVGQQRFPANRGDVLSIPAGMVYHWTLPDHPAEPCRRYTMQLSPEFVRMMQSVFLSDSFALGDIPYALPTADSLWESIGDSFRRCALECEQKLLRWETSVFGIATELAVQISRARQGNRETPQGKTELLDRIMAYVEAHLAEKITLPDIAARFWVSQSTISQLFRKNMGMSFYRYVTMRRLSESQLLIRSGLPMDQVSISVGFQDYSTFYRAFKAEYGISPAQYRKNH